MKRTKFIILATVLFGLMPVALTSCDDDDNYSPGAEPGVNDKGVYFSSDNASEFVKAEGDEKSVTVLVERENTEGELAVPIEVLSKTDNIAEVSSEAVFADGESEAEVIVTYTDLDTAPSCELKIPDEYANPYKEKDGLYRFTVSIYKLRTISTYVVYASDQGTPDYFSGATSELLQYEGSNIFILRNFLGSGIDFKFSISGSGSNFDASDPTKCYGGITPLDHYYTSGEGWYLMTNTDGSGDCATWTVPGSAYGVNDFMFFWSYSSDYSYHYNYIDLTPEGSGSSDYGYGYFESTIIDDLDFGTYSTFYFYVYY